jgi:tripartite-type tricarboxylate transporter receptor subunit TctC
VIDTNGFAVAAAPSLPAANVRELVSLARSRPGNVTYGTSVSLAQLLGLWLQKEAGVKLVEVRYKDIAQGIQDTMAGRIDIVVNSYTNLEPLVKAGKLKVLAVSTAERMPGLGSVETVAESYPGLAVGGLLVLTVPAGTPGEVVERANRETNAILRSPEFGQRVFRYGWHNVRGPRTLAETAEFVRASHARFKAALEATGFQPQ